MLKLLVRFRSTDPPSAVDESPDQRGASAVEACSLVKTHVVGPPAKLDLCDDGPFHSLARVASAVNPTTALEAQPPPSLIS